MMSQAGLDAIHSEARRRAGKAKANFQSNLPEGH